MDGIMIELDCIYDMFAIYCILKGVFVYLMDRNLDWSELWREIVIWSW